MGLQEAFAPIDEINKAIVMQDTWGHMAPEPGQKYKGYIIVACGVYGSTILDYDFEELDGGPWLAEDVDAFAFDAIDAGDTPAIYRFDGWYKKFKNGNCSFGGGKFCRHSTPGGAE